MFSGFSSTFFRFGWRMNSRIINKPIINEKLDYEDWMFKLIRFSLFEIGFKMIPLCLVDFKRFWDFWKIFQEFFSIWIFAGDLGIYEKEIFDLETFNKFYRGFIMYDNQLIIQYFNNPCSIKKTLHNFQHQSKIKHGIFL